MVKAVFFQTDESDWNMLTKLLRILRAENYSWQVKSSDVFSSDSFENILLRGSYSGSKILEALGRKYFVHCAELFAFKNNNAQPLNTYSDFISSDCELALFVAECDYFCMYCKNSSHFDMVMNYIRAANCHNIKLLTEDNAEGFFGA